MGCKREGCLYGYTNCCIVCEELPFCGASCSDMDKYEFSEDCPDYEVKMKFKILVMNNDDGTVEEFNLEEENMEKAEELAARLCGGKYSLLEVKEGEYE